jgi:radical SAM enzyme (TIGR01210 family)
MSERIAEIIKEIRSKARRTPKRNAVGVWCEKDRAKGEIVDSLVVILRTRGCYWAAISGCSMCGYYNDTNPEITKEDLIKQLEYAKSKYSGEKMIKIYTSGSFLDDREVPEEIQRAFIENFNYAERIIIETRPEFVTDKKIKFLKECYSLFLNFIKNSQNNGYSK